MPLIIKFFYPCVFMILVYMQCSGDLFVLETDGHVLTKFGEALWKRLTLVCDVTLTLTSFWSLVL